jgi:L-ascorbate metabolism protein UlaG (beta-lactamase superfamily)
MQVTFLAHSGFLIELDTVLLLFDWWTGTLPPLPAEKPLLVFASHGHEDHFTPDIFTLADDSRTVRFLLGGDIPLPETLPETAACIPLNGNETAAPIPGVTVETLPSTDEGVAFLVTAEGRTIYHAGDLNWWHWEGEDPAWNRQMELDFKAYSRPLEGRSIDLAMVPMDPRQEADGFRGAAWLLPRARVRHCLPMHQWENFDFTKAFLNKYPDFSAQIVPVTRLGERFTF